MRSKTNSKDLLSISPISNKSYKIPKDIDVVFLRDIFNCFDYQTNLKIISDIYDVFGRDVKIILICFYDRIVLKTFILSLLRLKFVNGYRNFLKLIRRVSEKDFK